MSFNGQFLINKLLILNKLLKWTKRNIKVLFYRLKTIHWKISKNQILVNISLSSEKLYIHTAVKAKGNLEDCKIIIKVLINNK